MVRNIRIVALASFIEGLIIFVWLASIPTSGGTFSPVRLVSLFTILLISLGCLAGFIRIKSENRFAQKIKQIANGNFGLPTSWLFITLSLALWVTVLYKSWLLAFIDEAVYTRSLPIAVWGMLFCMQLGILFLVPNIRKDNWSNTLGPIWKPTAILFGSFILVWVLMSVTHLGFVFDDVGLSWGPPGTPVSFPQINLVFALSLSLAFAHHILQSRISFPWRILDVVIMIGLWVLAAALWWNTPVSSTHFNSPPMAPNNEMYPNSDALIFDKSAYHLLYGTGFRDQLHRRPLYVGMLALFHKLSGSGYEETIFLQILVLALIPVLIYLLTSKLSNRLAGLMAGGLILLREKNAIELSDKIVTSNAKLMMSDMVALLGVLAFVYVMIKILEKKGSNIYFIGIAGACLGLTALVRAQVLILVPLLFLFIIISRKQLKFGIKDSSFVLLGFILVMLPWVWRNWELTGTFVLDDLGEERLLARNYSSNPIALSSPLPDESEQEFSARLKQGIFTYTIEHPLDVAFFVSNHFLRNMATSTVYMAPLISADSTRAVIDLSLFWESWQGKLNGNSGISIFVTLIFVSLGISIAQTKNKFAGWFPFAVFLTYSLGNALVRSSGWRFSLPVDWTTLMYYSIALAYLPSKIKLDSNSSLQTRSVSVSSFNKPSLSPIVFIILLLMGASVPIAERLIPVRDFSHFTENAEESLIRDNIISSSELDNFLGQENAVIYTGMALYPRYITPNSKVYLINNQSEETRFLRFWLINEGDNQVIFPTEKSPGDFPHTSTVTVIGCKQENYILAWGIILHTLPPQVFVQNPSVKLNCEKLISK